jgi:hypothetical protein
VLPGAKLKNNLVEISSALGSDETVTATPRAAASARAVGAGVPVVHRGFDTRDLKEAKALLKSLAG